MSTCIGTWRDMAVPSNAPGTVLALAHSDKRGQFMVVHDSVADCPTPEPHDASECGMFDPPRCEPDPDLQGPSYRLKQIYDWDALGL